MNNDTRYFRNNQSQIINQHFENINILSKIIENSQRLIENNQNFNTNRRYNNINRNYNNTNRNYNNTNRNYNNTNRRYNNTNRNYYSNTIFNPNNSDNSNNRNNLNNTNNPNSFFNLNNRNNDRNNDRNTYVIRFDALIPNLFNENTTQDNSYNIKHINIDNSNILQNTEDISNENIHLFDIEQFQYINDPINDICPITRERFIQEQNVIMINKCKHTFNKSSLNLWLSRNTTCPCCRVNILSD